VKPADLLRAIGEAAFASGRRLVFVRHGARHDIWRVGAAQFSIPRHREVGEKLALATGQLLEQELGDGWWR
jgi:hypothetical protein